jgi:cell division GTPase FtsZ
VQGISNIITIQASSAAFAGVKTIMAGMGCAVMGTAVAKERRAPRCASRDLSPLLGRALLTERGILINVTNRRHSNWRGE